MEKAKLGVFFGKFRLMQVAHKEGSVKLLMEELTNHKLYEGLKTLDDVKTFTEYHVFAVWDFMSL